jgi:hypothetical protein
MTTVTVTASRYRVIVDGVQVSSPVTLEIKKTITSAEWDSKDRCLYAALADESAVRAIVAKYNAPAKTVTTSVPDRVRIMAGKYNIGDMLNGKKIISFGKTWTQFVADEDTSAYGLQPGQSYNISVQYAYFN